MGCYDCCVLTSQVKMRKQRSEMEGQLSQGILGADKAELRVTGPGL